MEGHANKWAKEGSSIHTDLKMRQTRRPQPSNQLYEDLGTTEYTTGTRSQTRKGSSSQQSTSKPSSQQKSGKAKTRYMIHDDGSDDELLLSSDRESSVDHMERKTEKKSVKSSQEEKKGQKGRKEKLGDKDMVEEVKQRSDVLKGLKFKKKGAQSDDKSSLKENDATPSTSNDNLFDDSTPSSSRSNSRPSSSTVLKPVPPKDPNVRESPSNDMAKTPVPSKVAKSSSRRDLASKDAPSGPKQGEKRISRQASLKKTQSVIISDSSDEEDSSEAPKKGKAKGKKSRRVESPPTSPEPKQRANPFPKLSPLTTPVKKKPPSGNGPQGFPSLSPLSSQTAEENDRTVAKSKQASKSSGPRPMPLLSPLSSQNVPGDSNDFVIATEAGASLAKPFPLSLPDSNGSSPIAGPSKARHSEKRVSDEPAGGSAERAKRRKADIPRPTSDSDVNLDEDMDVYEALDEYFDKDPYTLCPFCDEDLPSTPTSLLKKLIARAVAKSKPEPRPRNRLGRKAPMPVYISVCHRHKFEKDVLPQADAKGWPKTIEFDKVEKRIVKMKSALQELIEDETWKDQMDEDSLQNFDHISPRSLCVFWKEALKDIKEKGSKAAANVKSQFSNFDKIQPGYYGEQGSVIIHHTLYELFPPSSIRPHLVAPLDPKEFIQRVLVPEVATRLIMEDKGLRGGAGAREAVQILRDSSKYGVSMFPEDGGDWEDLSKSQKQKEPSKTGLTAAEVMVRERARKRRKEIAEEDKIEQKKQEKAKESEKASRQSRATKDTAPKTVPEEAPKSRPRPKPKAIKRTTSTTSLGTTGQASASEGELEPPYEDVDGYVDPDARLFDEFDKMMNEENDFQPTWSRYRQDPPNVPLPSSTENSPQPATKPARKPRAAAEKARANLSVDGSDDDSDVSMASTRSRRRRKKGRTKPESRESSVDIVEPPPTFDDDPTPKPTRRLPTTSSSSTYPMFQAQERVANLRNKKSKDGWTHTMMQDGSDDGAAASPVSWLLSDDSHSEE